MREVAGDIAGRCVKCYEMRLFEPARQAAEGGFDSFTSSLFISPYQKHELMREVAERAAAEYGVHIFLLDWQVNAVKEILRGKRAVLHPITTDTTEEILRLPSELYIKETKPYITEKGEFLSAPI